MQAKHVPLDPTAWVLHTLLRLTAEEYGMYASVCMWTFREGQPIPEDYKWLSCVFSGMSARKSRRLVDRLIAKGLINRSDGRLSARYALDIIAGGASFPRWTELRQAVIDRDGERCSYCGDVTGPFEIDHKTPRAHGGTDHIGNLTVACRSCNRAKRAMPYDQWLALMEGGDHG